MKEYCIYNIWNGGTPFTSLTFKTFQEAYESLKLLIDTEEKRNRIYFVDNDFWNNKYPYAIKGCKIFSIRFREVTEWERVQQKQNNKIIYFENVDILKKM